MKTLNYSMPVLEIPFGDDDLETQNNAKSEEVERKYKIESPRKKMKFFARLKLENFNCDINTNDQEEKEKKNTNKKKQKLVKEISKSDPIESYQMKIGLEIQQNEQKFNQYHFKELDLGGYTLLVAPKIEREEAEEYYNKKNLKKLLKAEHKFVCQKVPFLTPTLSFYQKQERYPTACSYTNYSKNRYQDVLCNEESKFVFISESNDYLHQSMELEHSLESLLFDMHKTRTTVEEDSKYINANYVRGSHCSNSVFIATQAPMEKTFPEFFEMIWQSKSKVVISLTPLVENQRAKMTPFWPLSKKPFLVSHFSILLADETSHNDIVIRKLEIKNINNGVTRCIYQIHFVGWLDNDVPSDPLSLIHIYSLQRKYEAEGSLEGLDGPSIVHCSAGIGRTSTYISFVFGAQIACQLKRSSPLVSRLELNLALDVPSIVINVRKQRCGSVQTWKQYGLIYKAINFYIKHEFISF